MSAISITYYNPATGEVIQNSDLFTEAEIEMNTPVGCGYIEGTADPKIHYILAGVITDRPLVPAMLTATYNLNQLVPGAELTIIDEVGFETVILAQDDTLELTDSGIYKVSSSSPFPSIDFNAEVVVA